MEAQQTKQPAPGSQSTCPGSLAPGPPSEAPVQILDANPGSPTCNHVTLSVSPLSGLHSGRMHNAPAS